MVSDVKAEDWKTSLFSELISGENNYVSEGLDRLKSEDLCEWYYVSGVVKYRGLLGYINKIEGTRLLDAAVECGNLHAIRYLSTIYMSDLQLQDSRKALSYMELGYDINDAPMVLTFIMNRVSVEDDKNKLQEMALKLKAVMDDLGSHETLAENMLKKIEERKSQ